MANFHPFYLVLVVGGGRKNPIKVFVIPDHESMARISNKKSKVWIKAM